MLLDFWSSPDKKRNFLSAQQEKATSIWPLKFLTLLNHRNIIICLQICKKHAKLTYLFIWKNNATVSYSSLKMCFPCRDVCLCFGLFNPPTASLPNCISNCIQVASWQKTQRISFQSWKLPRKVRAFLWCHQSGNLRVGQVRRRGRVKKDPLQYFGLQYLVQPLSVNPTFTFYI